jgi:hypothetical protein
VKPQFVPSQVAEALFGAAHFAHKAPQQSLMVFIRQLPPLRCVPAGQV